MSRGYWGIAIWGSKDPQNLGTIWRTAHVFGAAFVARVGPIRYKHGVTPGRNGPTDTNKT